LRLDCFGSPEILFPVTFLKKTTRIFKHEQRPPIQAPYIFEIVKVLTFKSVNRPVSTSA
jgi:hypothetical protein